MFLALFGKYTFRHCLADLPHNIDIKLLI